MAFLIWDPKYVLDYMSLLLEMQLLRGESADGATKRKYVFVASQQNNVAVLTEIDSAAALTQIEMREVYTLPSTLLVLQNVYYR